MKYLLNPSTDPYYNMALDEYCLEHIRSDAPYFFLWRNAPSVIIGLNQNAYGEVNLPFLEENGIRLVRRMTGGGAVYHDLQNLNYTLIGAHPSPQPIVEALRTLGVAAELTGRNDIFVDGKKVSGYARRVSHGQEIIHGTLMYDVDLDTLIRALDTPTSKMNAKGIASVRSRVGNLKGILPDFPSLDALQARRLELSEVVFGEKPQRGAEADVRRLAHRAQGGADVVHILAREASARCDDADPVRPVRRRLARGLHAGVRAHPAVCFAACLPVGGLRAPLAVLGAAPRARIDDGAEIEALFHAPFGHFVRPFAQLLPPFRLQQRQSFFSVNAFHLKPRSCCRCGSRKDRA